MVGHSNRSHSWHISKQDTNVQETGRLARHFLLMTNSNDPQAEDSRRHLTCNRDGTFECHPFELIDSSAIKTTSPSNHPTQTQLTVFLLNVFSTGVEDIGTERSCA